MAVPFPYPTNITNVMSFISFTNSLVGGFLGIAMLIIIGAVTFLSSKIYSYEKALGFSGFMVLVSSILLRFMNMINDTVLIVCILLFVGTVILMFGEREKEGL